MIRRRRRRSTRSVFEIGFVAVFVAAIWIFTVAGGPALVGQWFGTQFAPR